MKPITVADLVDSLLTHFDPSDVLFSVNLEGTPGNKDYRPVLADHHTQGLAITRRIDTGATYSDDYDSWNGYAPYVCVRKAA